MKGGKKEKTYTEVIKLKVREHLLQLADVKSTFSR